ncbi:MAG: guanylate cyclase, partial [Caldilineae bacterium]
MVSALLNALSSYVPQLVIRHLADHPEPLTEPVGYTFPAAVLLADIIGFTPLTDRLAERGYIGAEELTYLLNVYFEEIIELFTIHGGDVVKFAGDALLALWPIGATGDDLTTVTRRATQAALLVQTMLHDHKVQEDVRLSLRIGIGVGDVFAAHIGGVYGRWELLVTGEPFVQVRQAQNHARSGEVVLSPQSWALVQAYSEGYLIEDGFAAVTDIHAPLPFFTPEPYPLLPRAEAALRGYIPGTVLSRVIAGQGEWISELRQVAVLFISLPDIRPTQPQALEQAQRMMSTLQTAIYRYEGSINKISVDDKGSTLIAAMGLPPLAHEDDTVRAVRAALAIQAELRRMGLRSNIGVASGRVFCGAIGSVRRREYTMIGDVVNMAARLMQAASDDILCDAATYQIARSHIHFEALSPIPLKGKTNPVPVYRPHSEAKITIAPKTDMVGRVDEKTFLVHALQSLLRGGVGGVILIEGEAGIGKSRLVEELQRQAEILHINTFLGRGDALEQNTPYSPWRAIFHHLLNFPADASPETRRRRVQELLASNPNQRRLAPLLSDVLRLDLPDNDFTASMDAAARAQNRHELLLQLVQASITRAPKVLILEDAHWLDSASWRLALAVSQQIESLLLVIVARPFTAAEHHPPE